MDGPPRILRSTIRGRSGRPNVVLLFGSLTIACNSGSWISVELCCPIEAIRKVSLRADLHVAIAENHAAFR
jgi:hypothetical protein